MNGYQKILVPLDGSETSEAILPEIEKLASAFGASICLLGVIPTPIIPGSVGSAVTYQTVLETLIKETKEYLRKLEIQLTDKGFTVETRLEQGHAAQQILEHCDREDINLVAMSTHGRSGVKRWLLGSVAEKILHHATKPVFLVRSTETE